MDVLSALLVPSGVAAATFILGLLLAAAPRTRIWSWVLLALSGAITFAFSSGAIAALLISPLEHRHPALGDPNAYAQVRRIVVLTGWASNDPDLPLSGRMNSSSAYRVLLALEIFRERPDCEIIVSGDEVTAHIMAEVITKLGVPAGRVQLEDGSASTEESAERLQQFVGSEPFFLVTSAGHLPRSLDAMQRVGLKAVPAPTDHQLPKDWTRAELAPRPESLVASNLAVHEYAARLWHSFRTRAPNGA